MATSKLFDGVDDVMSYTGASPSMAGVAHSLLIVAKILQADGSWMSMIETEKTGPDLAPSLGRRSDNTIYYSNTFGLDSKVSITSADGWMIICATKAAGTNEPTFHKLPIGGSRTTLAGTGGTLGDQVGAQAVIRIGGNDDFANMEVACAAFWAGVELNTTQLDTLLAAKTSASILALSPSWMVDASDGLVSDQTAGTIDRTAVVGTAAGASDPSGWIYLGGGPTVIAPAAGGPAAPVVPVPKLTLISPAVGSTASRVIPALSITVVAVASGATAAPTIPVISRSKTITGVVGTATASRATPNVGTVRLIVVPAVISTASRVVPLPMLSVSGVATATASRVAPVIGVTIISPAAAATASRPLTKIILGTFVVALPAIAYAGMRLREATPTAVATATAAIPNIVKQSPQVVAPAGRATAIASPPQTILNIRPPAATANAIATGVPEIRIDLTYDSAAGAGMLLALAAFEAGVEPPTARASAPVSGISIAVVPGAMSATASRSAPVISTSASENTIAAPAGVSTASRAVPSLGLIILPAAAPGAAQSGAVPSIQVQVVPGLASAAGLPAAGFGISPNAVPSAAVASVTTPVIRVTITSPAVNAVAAGLAPVSSTVIPVVPGVAVGSRPVPTLFNTASTTILAQPARATALVAGVDTSIVGFGVASPAHASVVIPGIVITLLPNAPVATASTVTPGISRSGSRISPAAIAVARFGVTLPKILVGIPERNALASAVSPTITSSTLVKYPTPNSKHMVLSAREDDVRVLSGIE